MTWLFAITSLAMIGILIIICIVLNAIRMEILNLQDVVKKGLYVTSGEYLGYGHNSELEIVRNILNNLLEENSKYLHKLFMLDKISNDICELKRNKGII